MFVHVINALIAAVVVLGLAAGILWLEIRLARQPGKWPGLALPLCTFLVSLFYGLNLRDTGDATQNVLAFLSLLLLLNISTAILLLVYFHFRSKRKDKTQIDKMNVQDLE